MHVLWYSRKCTLKTDTEEKKSLNKVIFVFFAHKKYSRSFIKLRLNPWCHMDYFNNVLITFLGLERASCVAVYVGSERIRIFIFGLTNHLSLSTLKNYSTILRALSSLSTQILYYSLLYYKFYYMLTNRKLYGLKVTSVQYFKHGYTFDNRTWDVFSWNFANMTAPLGLEVCSNPQPLVCAVSCCILWNILNHTKFKSTYFHQKQTWPC